MPVTASYLRCDGLFCVHPYQVKMFTEIVVFAAIAAASLNILCTGYIVARALLFHYFNV